MMRRIKFEKCFEVDIDTLPENVEVMCLTDATLQDMLVKAMLQGYAMGVVSVLIVIGFMWWR